MYIKKAKIRRYVALWSNLEIFLSLYTVGYNESEHVVIGNIAEYFYWFIKFILMKMLVILKCDIRIQR